MNICDKASAYNGNLCFLHDIKMKMESKTFWKENKNKKEGVF